MFTVQSQNQNFSSLSIQPPPQALPPHHLETQTLLLMSYRESEFQPSPSKGASFTRWSVRPEEADPQWSGWHLQASHFPGVKLKSRHHIFFFKSLCFPAIGSWEDPITFSQ